MIIYRVKLLLSQIIKQTECHAYFHRSFRRAGRVIML